jgi:hypothetical protein
MTESYRSAMHGARYDGTFGLIALVMWVLLLIVGSLTTFVPSTAWQTWRWIPVSVAGLGSSLWVVSGLHSRANVGALSPLMRIAGFYILFPLCLCWMAWCIVGFTLPGFLTRLLGASNRETIPFTKTYDAPGWRNGSCHYRIESAAFDQSLAGYYCALEHEWKALPNEGSIDVRSHVSWLGRRVDYVTAAVTSEVTPTR